MGRASEKRIARVRSLILRALSEMVNEELKDPRLGIFSLTDLQLSRDMSHADVLVSAVGGREASEECCKILTGASPLLWNRLRRETDLRTIPQLHFKPDHGSEYEQEIFQLLENLPPPAVEQPEAGEE